MEHHVQPGDEVEAPPLAHHSIGLFLNCTAPRRVTRFAVQEFDGVQQRGDLSLVAAGHPSYWYWEGQDELMLFVIQPDFLKRIAAETNEVNGDFVELISAVNAHDPALLSLGLSFHQEMQQPRFGSKLYAESLATLFALHLLRNYCALQSQPVNAKGGLSKNKLRKVQDYIHDHLHQDIKLNELAMEVGMSRYHLIRSFKQSTGSTPHQYLLQQRIQRAKQLLEQQNGAIVDVALQCGFANQSHFTQSFRKITGTTPHYYRRQL